MLSYIMYYILYQITIFGVNYNNSQVLSNIENFEDQNCQTVLVKIYYNLKSHCFISDIDWFFSFSPFIYSLYYDYSINAIYIVIYFRRITYIYRWFRKFPSANSTPRRFHNGLEIIFDFPVKRSMKITSKMK